MKIIFIGCVTFSKVMLECLLENNIEIVAILTKEQSNINSDFFDLSIIAEKYAIPYKYVNNINDTENIAWIDSFQGDYIYCLGWSQLLGEELLSLPKFGSVGYHPASLPQNRGRHPLIWALVLGLEELSSTFFLLEEGCDSGAILSQESIPIAYEDTAGTMYKKIELYAKNQVVNISVGLTTGTLVGKPQDHTKANIWRKRGKLDGQLDFRMSSYSLYNLVRGLSSPYPNAHFLYQEKEYKVYEAEEVKTEGEYRNIEFGKVLEVYTSQSFLVKTGDHLLKIISCDPISLQEGDYL